MMNLKYSHSRSFHDLRLARTAKSNTKPHNKRNNTSGLTKTNANTGEPQIENSTVDVNGNCLECIETEQTVNKTATDEINETGNGNEDVLETVDKHSISSSVSLPENRPQQTLINNNVAVNDSALDVNENSDNHNNRIRFLDANDILDKDQNVLDDDKTGRNLKTAFSRTSRNTAKSCPAQIQTRSKVRQKSTTQGLALRSKSAHKNSEMFNKMSKEAHHAITETVKEMNATRSKSTFVTEYSANKNGVRFYPSRSRKSVSTWVLPKQDSRKSNTGYNATKVLENASNKMQELIDSNVELVHRASSENSSAAHESHRSSRCSSANLGRKNSPKLPDIQNDLTKDKLTSKSQLYRLPGIGNYDVPILKDGMFEITPPGFDSRYNDLQPVEERESETPPPDIRQRAIDKCSEWLTKYSHA